MAGYLVVGGPRLPKRLFPKALGNLSVWSNASPPPPPPHPCPCQPSWTSLHSHYKGCHLQCRQGRGASSPAGVLRN